MMDGLIQVFALFNENKKKKKKNTVLHKATGYKHKSTKAHENKLSKNIQPVL